MHLRATPMAPILLWSSHAHPTRSLRAKRNLSFGAFSSWSSRRAQARLGASTLPAVPTPTQTFRWWSRPTRSECTIAGDGALAGVGAFNGPAGLGQLMVQSSSFESCVVKQVFRFSQGRRELASDVGLLQHLGHAFKDSGRHFDEVLLALVTHPTFTQRTETP